MAILLTLGLLMAALVIPSGPAIEPTSLRAQFGFCHEGGGINCVVDGDTFWAGGKKVRIAGIEAPETHEPRCPEEAERGRAATRKLQDLLNSGTVTLTPDARGQDQHGRLLRHVSVGGKDVGEALIAAGLAREYRGGKKPWCD